MNDLVLLPAVQQEQLVSRLTQLMKAQGIDYALISSNANIYYLTGRVYSGYVLVIADGRVVYLVKRPVHLEDKNALSIHKPENIPAVMEQAGIKLEGRGALELGRVTYNNALRLSKALGMEEMADITPILAQARAVKTPYEIDLIKKSGVAHARVYHQIPALYQPGMTDLELQVEIERISRLDGCLGQFRIAGDDMELYMGNVLAGNNADAPSPYDFAMGGAGIDPSLPIGADGTIIKPGMAVMVDMNGNFCGYMTDMTRCYALGKISDKALQAHELSIRICQTLAEMGRPGVEAKTMYDTALAMAKEAHLEDYFMGHRQHAGFVGHGIGIEVNEMPVLAPRSRDVLQAGNVIAVEPKFVIPDVGAVGVENTYVVRADAPMECLTIAPEHIINFD